MRGNSSQARESARKRATSRHNASKVAMKRKEEYLGARVPRELRNKVVQRADDLGIPVSILIRDVLMAAFGESHAGMALSPEKVTTIEPDFASVLGWEDIRLIKAVQCARCRTELPAGSIETIGISDSGGRPIVLCKGCKEAV